MNTMMWYIPELSFVALQLVVGSHFSISFQNDVFKFFKECVILPELSQEVSCSLLRHLAIFRHANFFLAKGSLRW